MINDWKFLKIYYEKWENNPVRQFLTGFNAINAKTIKDVMGSFLENLEANEIDPTYGKTISFTIFQAIVLDVQEKHLGTKN